MKQTNSKAEISTVRLDRWLWAARFFKTRALAKQAIEGGKVQLNGQRTKPGRAVSCTETLKIRRGDELFTVIITGVAEKRGPAKIARTLYAETEESQILRQKAAELRRIEQLSVTPVGQRPDKKQRRKIHQFKNSF